MEIQHSMRDGCLVLSFTGSIDLFSVSAVQRTVLKDLSHEPYALMCDLSGVTHLDPVCASVFATVANHPSSRWPTTSFLLCSAQPAVAATLGRLQVPQFLSLYASLEEALDAAVDRPPYLRDELRLAPTLTAAAVARAHVRDILTYWQLALPDTTVVHGASQCAAAADLGAEVGVPGRDFHDAAPCRLDLTFLIGVPLDRRSVLRADLRLPEQIRASTSAEVG